MYLCRAPMYRSGDRISRVDLITVASLETIVSIHDGDSCGQANCIAKYPRLSGDKTCLYCMRTNPTTRYEQILTEQPFEYNCVADQQLDKVPIQIEREVQVQSKVYMAVR
jgi:hypothetical protein